MKYEINLSNQFNRDIKRLAAQGKDLSKLDTILKLLGDGKQLPTKNRDHQLKGDMKAFRECHIEPNWLLIYRIDNDKLILYAIRTGSHNQLGLTSNRRLVTSKEVKQYAYKGPLAYRRWPNNRWQLVSRDYQASVLGKSPDDALNNIRKAYKRKTGREFNEGYVKLDPSSIHEVEAYPKLDYCENCGYALTETGQCPVCDLGEEDY